MNVTVQRCSALGHPASAHIHCKAGTRSTTPHDDHLNLTHVRLTEARSRAEARSRGEDLICVREGRVVPGVYARDYTVGTEVRLPEVLHRFQGDLRSQLVKGHHPTFDELVGLPVGTVLHIVSRPGVLVEDGGMVRFGCKAWLVSTLLRNGASLAQDDRGVRVTTTGTVGDGPSIDIHGVHVSRHELWEWHDSITVESTPDPDADLVAAMQRIAYMAEPNARQIIAAVREHDKAGS